MFSRQFISFFLLASVCFFACKKVDIQFGQELVDNEYTQIVRVDTFSAELSTVLIDSFITSAKGVTLLGGYTDPQFGRIDTRCFFDLVPPTYIAHGYDSTRFDSLTLILRLDRSYYGDTVTTPLHLEVRQILQQIVFPQENVSYFYNNQSFKVDSTDPPMGTANVFVNPTFYTDSITIRLPDTLGQKFLSKLQNPNDYDLQSNISFLDYFYGLCLSSNSSTNLILGCKDSVIMRLSYEKTGIDSIEKYHADFTLANKQHHFNNISVNRAGTPLSSLGTTPSLRVISSTQLNNQAFSQYASGVATKITFSSLGDLLKIPSYKKILRAQLKLVPVKGYYNTTYYLPPALTLAATDLNNGVGSALGGYSSNGSFATQTGNLFLDNAYGDNTAYTYDLTAFIKQYIQNPIDNNTGLLVVPPSPASVTQFPRIVIGDRYQQYSKTLLEIYYVTVQ
jgi:hypothetical protein